MKSSVVDSSKERLIFVGMMLMIILFYSYTTTFGFVWDDFDLIVDNPYLRNSFSPLQIFSSGLWDHSLTGFHYMYYRPITNLVTVFEYKFFGLFAGGYHMVSLCLHLISLQLLWKISRKLSFNLFQSALVGILFSFHPVQISAVCYIASQGDLLTEIFVLLSIVFWMGPNRRTYLSILSAFVACLCKEIAILTPLVLLSWDIVIEKKSIKRLSMYAPFIVWFPYVILRILFMDQGHISHMPWSQIFSTPGSYRILLFVTRLLFPFPTSSEWTLPTFSLFHRLLIHVAFAGIVLFTFIKLKNKRIATFFAIWFLAIIFPIADWIGSGIRFSDQLLYVTLAPVCLSIAYFIRNKMQRVFISFVVVGITILSFVELQHWRSDQSFWKNEIKYRPNDISTQINYSVMLLRNQNLDEGCPFLLKTYETIQKVGAPSLNSLQLVLNNLGSCYLSRDPVIAEKYLRESLSFGPTFFTS